MCGEVQAQQFSDARFGVIPDSLHEMQPPQDNPEVPYQITNKEVDVAFQEADGTIMAILEYHIRLKVFDESAREAARVAIPYYYANDMEKVSDIRGITHLPSGRRVPLDEEIIKTINLNARYNVIEFTMPAVEEGAVIEYSYVIQRRYIEELPDFYLSHEVPTSVAKITLTYPEYLRYDETVENYEGSIQHDFMYTDTSSVPKIFMVPQPNPIVTEQWVARDIPAVEEQPYITSLNDYRGKIKFLLSEFGIPRQTLETSWEYIVAKLRRDLNPWQQVRRNDLAEELGDSIARANDSASLKSVQDSIFRFVNGKVNFSGAHTPYSATADTTVISGEAVDQAAINQTLMAMLHGAGIEASPLLVSTRPSGKINKEFPSFYQFNGQLIQSEIEGESYLMDASYPHSQPGLIPVDMYNGPGLLLRQGEYEWTDINPRESSFDIQVDMEADLSESGTLTGTVITHQSGYPAQRIRQQKSDGQRDMEILKQSLFEGYAQAVVDNVELNNLSSYEEPVRLEGDFEIDGYATSFSDGLDFRPMIVGYMMENPFEDSSRDLPVNLDAPEELDVSYTISLSAGFFVEQGRQNRSLQLPGAAFTESYDLKQHEMNYDYQIDISSKEFSTDLFPQLYDLYRRWVELSNTTWMIESN